MALISRLLLYSLLAIGVVRVIIYIFYASFMLPVPFEAHNLESKMVLLAYRVERGLSLYPAWWGDSYVTNFFGPVDFLAVGGIGRLLGADIRGLFLIGRTLSFATALSTTIVVAFLVGRRSGRGAGLAAAVMSLGAMPMFGFTIMVRPDGPAEFLGMVGFFLAVARRPRVVAIGVVVLVLATLTKQTAGAFLAAAALAWAWDGKYRRAFGVLAGGIAALGSIVLAVTVGFEPHFARSLVAESMMPWDAAAWRALFDRVVLTSSDVLLMPILGLWLWVGPGARARDVRPAALTLVLLAASLGLSGKIGADMNYYMSLRIAEALAVGTLWRRIHADPGPGRAPSASYAAAIGLVVATMGPGLLAEVGLFDRAYFHASSFGRPDGRMRSYWYRQAIAQAENPRIRLLTDSGLLDLYQGERAAFGDPWLFRNLVEIGKIRPTVMAERVDSRFYDVIITLHDLGADDYLGQDFRLPRGIVERVRAHYVLRDAVPGLFYYGRRDNEPRRSPRPR
jgi:hypothetical protein